jgi:hypothetical protein
MVTNSEPGGEGRTVSVVPVEQLNHAGGSTGCADAFLDAVPVDGIDHPDATVHDERVRAPFHELDDDPAEAGVELVTEADAHP